MTLLVTGGAAGIGLAVAELARARGVDVVTLDPAHGIDASDPDAVAALVESRGPFTEVAHIAGVVGSGSVEGTSLEEWYRIVEANLTSAFVVARAVLPGMLAHEAGSFVFMSSLNARDGGTPLSGPSYAAAKAGALGLMRHIARNYAAKGIRANAVAPGPVRTAMHDRLTEDERVWLKSLSPLGRVSEAAEIAEMVLFLLSPHCASVTGMTFDVNGGAHMS